MAGASPPVLKGIDGGQKDRRALLRELYTAYGGSVYGRCRYLLKGASKAEDAMQEVFARALTHSEGLRAESSPLAWLTKIATHHCLWVDGMTLEEVAAMLGRSVPTVRKRLEQFAALTNEELKAP